MKQKDTHIPTGRRRTWLIFTKYSKGFELWTIESKSYCMAEWMMLGLFAVVSGKTFIVLSVERLPFSNLNGTTIH